MRRWVLIVAPEQLLSGLAGAGQPYAVPAGAVLGVPLYLPTEAPCSPEMGAARLRSRAGPAFAFMITAVSLSLPEFVLLSRISACV